jgi:hypothetical protein
MLVKSIQAVHGKYCYFHQHKDECQKYGSKALQLFNLQKNHQIKVTENSIFTEERFRDNRRRKRSTRTILAVSRVGFWPKWCRLVVFRLLKLLMKLIKLLKM